MNTNPVPMARDLCLLLPRRDRIFLQNFPQHGCVLLIEDTLQNTTVIGNEIPQSAVMPVIEIVPIGPVNNRVNGNAFHGHATPDRLPHFTDDLSEPWSPPHSKMAGFRNKKRTLVTFVHLRQ